MPPVSLGPDTFGDVTLGPEGRPHSMDRTLCEVLDQATLANEIRFDFNGLGEHHQADFAVSAPERSCWPPSLAGHGWPPVTKHRFLAEVTNGPLYVGSPETVARKITRTTRALGI